MTETKRVTTVREKTTITSSGTHAGKQGSCRQSGHALLLLRQGDSRRLREFFNKRLGTSRVNSSDSKYDEANQINTHASPVAALLVRQGGLGLEPASPQVRDSFVQRTSRGWSCCAWPVAALLLRRQGDVAHRTFTGDKSREAHVNLTERLRGSGQVHCKCALRCRSRREGSAKRELAGWLRQAASRARPLQDAAIDGRVNALAPECTGRSDNSVRQ